MLANVLTEQEKWAAAEGVYLSVIDRYPSYSYAFQRYGDFLLERGRYTEAETLYRRALRLTPADAATAYRNLGVALCQQQQFPAAEAAYREAIRLAPSYPTFYFNLADLLAGLGRTEEAEAVREAATRLD